MRKRWISLALALSIAASAFVGLAAVSNGNTSTGAVARWGVGASSVSAPANRSAASKAATSSATQTIVVTEPYSNESASLTPSSTSTSDAGHYNVFRDPLYASDTQVGHVLATCMTGFAGDSLCRGVLEFADGNITIDGSSLGTDGSFFLSITGGTGKYERASGQVNINTAASPTAARITVELTSG